MNSINFTLPDQYGKTHTLTDYRGKWVVVYFYPEDDTPGCTAQACGFRDRIDEYTKRGVVVLGISKDTVGSHKKFSDKYKLSFPILANPDKSVIEAFGAWGEKTMFGRDFAGTLRNTYLINPEGEIVKVYERVNALVNPQEVLSDFSALGA